MSFQVESFIWTVVRLVPAMLLAFYGVSAALRWRRQRNQAWIEWRSLLSILDDVNENAFSNGVTTEAGQDEGTTVTRSLIEDSRFRYERSSGKRFFFKSNATTSRFGSGSV